VLSCLSDVMDLGGGEIKQLWENFVADTIS